MNYTAIAMNFGEMSLELDQTAPVASNDLAMRELFDGELSLIGGGSGDVCLG